MHTAAFQRILGLALALALAQETSCKSEPDRKPTAPDRQARPRPPVPAPASPEAPAARSPSSQDLVATGFDELRRRTLLAADDCTPSGCGGNSPIVNRFPVNGLHPDGRRNAQGYRLVPHSIKSPDSHSPCNGQTLTVVEEEFGSRLTTRDPSCGPAQLDHSQFAVEDTKTGKQRYIIIEYSDMVPHVNKYWPLAYKFIDSDDKSRRSLCDTTASLDFQKKLSDSRIEKDPLWEGLKKMDDLALAARSDLDVSRWGAERTAKLGTESGSGPAPEATKANQTDLAIVFFGEVRGENTETLPGSIGTGWFNIACARDALAKLDLDSIEEHKSNPSSSADYEKRRSAALKMVTAYYCPRPGQPGHSARYTYENNEIEWERKSEKGTWEPHRKIHNPNVEAFWSPAGPMCLSHTRLYGKNPPSGIPLISLPAGCQAGQCPDEHHALEALKLDCPYLNIQNLDIQKKTCKESQYRNLPDVFFISHSH